MKKEGSKPTIHEKKFRSEYLRIATTMLIIGELLRGFNKLIFDGGKSANFCPKVT